MGSIINQMAKLDMRILLISLGFFALTFTASAQLLDFLPFVGDDTEQMPPEEQQRLAAPILADAIEAEEAGREGRALDLYEDVFDDYPESEAAAEAVFRTGRIRMSQQKWKQAFEAYRELFRSYPDYGEFNIVISDIYDLAVAASEGRGLRWLGIIPYKSTENAISYFEFLVAAAPFSEYAPLALMNLAFIHQRKGNVIGAVDSLDRIINFYPDSMLSSDAYLELAKTFEDQVQGAYYDQGSTREAISYYRDFLILYPDSPAVAEGEAGLAAMEDQLAASKLILGEWYFRYRQNYSAARVFFNEAITVSPESPSAQEAREYLARIEELAPELDSDAVVTEAPASSRQPEERRGFFSRVWDTVTFWDGDDEEDTETSEDQEDADQREAEDTGETLDGVVGGTISNGG